MARFPTIPVFPLLGPVLLVCACSSIRPLPADLPVPAQPARLAVRASVRGNNLQPLDLSVSRLIEIETTPDGGWIVRPLQVRVEGSGYVVLDVAKTPEGGIVMHSEHRSFSGAEGPALALASPPLAVFWAAAQSSGQLLRAGYLSGQGALRPLRGGVFATSLDPVEDPRFFQSLFPPDLDLALFLGLAPGSWQPGETRKRSYTLDRLAGEAALRYRGLDPEGGAVFEVRSRAGGSLYAPPAAYPQLARTVTGTLHLAADGVVKAFRLEAVTTLSYPEPSQAETIETTARARPAGAPAPSWKQSQARRFASLMELRRRDRSRFTQAVLDETVAQAAALLHRVRPLADLKGIRAEVWGPKTQEQPTRRILSRFFAQRLLKSQAGLLVALHLFTAKQLQDFRTRMVGGEAGPDWAAGMAEHGRILLRPDQAGDLATVTHELAHEADERAGYLRGQQVLAGKPDPAWADLDGYLAAWALEEASAIASEAAAGLEAERSHGARRVWSWLERRDSGRIDQKDLVASVLGLVYGRSPLLIAARHKSGASLEQTLARTWEGFSYRTREILFPRRTVAPSRLWERVRRNRPELERLGATGATRIGAFLLRRQLAGRIEDDLAIRTKSGVLWLIEAGDAKSAAALRAACARLLPDATVTAHGAWVEVRIGKIRNAASLIRRTEPGSNRRVKAADPDPG